MEGKGASCGIIVHTISFLPDSGVIMFLWDSFVFTFTLRSAFFIAWIIISVSFYGTTTFMKQNITSSENIMWVIHFHDFLILLNFLVGILKLKVK